jgi:hypothetical protein
MMIWAYIKVSRPLFPPPPGNSSMSVLTCKLNLGLVWNGLGRVYPTRLRRQLKVSPVQLNIPAHGIHCTTPPESLGLSLPPPVVSSPRSAVACECGVYSTNAYLVITSPRRTRLRASWRAACGAHSPVHVTGRPQIRSGPNRRSMGAACSLRSLRPQA